MSSKPTVVQDGYYSDGGALDVASGKYNHTAESECSVGWYCVGGRNYKCSAGSYSSDAGSFVGCALCPAGYYQDAEAQSSCTSCPTSYFARVQNASTCLYCDIARCSSGGTLLGCGLSAAGTCTDPAQQKTITSSLTISGFTLSDFAADIKAQDAWIVALCESLSTDTLTVTPDMINITGFASATDRRLSASTYSSTTTNIDNAESHRRLEDSGVVVTYQIVVSSSSDASTVTAAVEDSTGDDTSFASSFSNIFASQLSTINSTSYNFTIDVAVGATENSATESAACLEGQYYSASNGACAACAQCSTGRLALGCSTAANSGGACEQLSVHFDAELSGSYYDSGSSSSVAAVGNGGSLSISGSTAFQFDKIDMTLRNEDGAALSSSFYNSSVSGYTTSSASLSASICVLSIHAAERTGASGILAASTDLFNNGEVALGVAADTRVQDYFPNLFGNTFASPSLRADSSWGLAFDGVLLSMPDALNITIRASCAGMTTSAARTVHREDEQSLQSSACSCGNFAFMTSGSCGDCPKNAWANHPSDSCLDRCKCQDGHYEAPCTSSTLEEGASAETCAGGALFQCVPCPLGGSCQWEANSAGDNERSSQHVIIHNGFWMIKHYFTEVKKHEMYFERCHEGVDCRLCLETQQPIGFGEVVNDMNCTDVCKCPGMVTDYTTAGDGCRLGHKGPLCAQCSCGDVNSNSNSSSSGCFFKSPEGMCNECPPPGSADYSVFYILFFVVLGIATVALTKLKSKVTAGVIWARRMLTEMKDQLLQVEDGVIFAEDVNDKASYVKQLLMRKGKEVIHSVMIKAKIITGLAQVMTTFSGNFTVEWPASFTKFTASLEFMNLNIFQMESVACSFNLSFIDVFAVYAIAPLVIVGVVCIAHFLGTGISIPRLCIDIPPKWTKYNIFCSTTRCAHVLIFMFFMIYPKLCNQILMIFFCKKFENGDSYLVADMDVKCHGDELVKSSLLGHMTYPELSNMAFAFCIIYILGVPLAFFAALYFTRETHFLSTEVRDEEEDSRKIVLSRGDYDDITMYMEAVTANEANRQLVAESDAVSKSIGELRAIKPRSVHECAISIQCFVRMSLRRHRYVELARVALTQKVLGGLFLSYEPQFYWWEVLELFRKLLLTGLIIFVMPETPTQLAVGCLITLAFMVLYSYAQPYEDILDDVLQLFCQLAIFSNYFSGLLLMVKADGADQTEFHNFMLSMNLIPIGLGACFLLDFLLVPLLLQSGVFIKNSIQNYTSKRPKIEPDRTKKSITMLIVPDPAPVDPPPLN
jgi:hypothetical protein